MGGRSTPIFPILIPALFLSTLFVVGTLTVWSDEINVRVFQRKHISSFADKIWLVKTLGLWLSFFLFGLASMVMLMRILTGKSNAASNTDPLYISVINRILMNTIEQSVIFAGLLGSILFADEHESVSSTQILSLASIFVVGRILFSIGYVFGAITKLPLRSLGFAIHVQLNIILITYHLGYNTFDVIRDQVLPLMKPFFG